MKRKLLVILLAVAMCLTIVTGCEEKEEATEEQETVVEEVEETAEEVEEAVEVTAEEVPDAAYYYSFDGEAEGAMVKINNFESTDAITVETRIIDSDKTLLYTDGVAGQCAYFDGTYGIELPVDPVGDTYTISFWMNAARFSDYGATIQYGQDLYSENTSARWVNFTKTTFPGDSTFPTVWSRDEAADLWPWFDAEDNVTYGKKEWVNIAMVVDPAVMSEDGLTINASLYINGELIDKECQLVPSTMVGDDTFKFYIGINCWDTIYKGAIDELYIFDQALTAGQVLSLYEAGDGTVELVEPEAAEEVVEIDYTRTDVVADETAIESIGTTDCTMGFWTAHTTATELADGETKTVVFNNYSNGEANWDNYVVAFTNTATTIDLLPSADNYEGYAEYAVIRGDLYGWGDESYVGAFEGSWGDDWTTFLEVMKNAKVTLTITRSGGEITMNAVIVNMVDNAEYTSTSVITTSAAADSPVYFSITGEKCYIEVLSIE